MRIRPHENGPRGVQRVTRIKNRLPNGIAHPVLKARVGCRSAGGEIVSYPVVQTIHEDSILLITEAPADVKPAVADAARALARQAVGTLSGAGIFGCASPPAPPPPPPLAPSTHTYSESPCPVPVSGPCYTVACVLLYVWSPEADYF